MLKKFFSYVLIFIFCITAIFSQNKTFEFINQDIKDILFIFSTQLQKPILADSTVSGETSFQFVITDTEKAFESFLQANRLFSYENDGVLYISKISVTKNEDNTINLVSYDASAMQIIERIAATTGTTITYETLPSVKNSICAEKVSVIEVLEILLKPYSEYSIIPNEKYIFVQKASASKKSSITDAASRLEIFQDEIDDSKNSENAKISFSAYINKSSFRESIEKLFSLTDENYTSFVTDEREIEHVQFSNLSFEESLALIVDGGGAKSIKTNGMWFIFQEESRIIQENIKVSNNTWKHCTLKYNTFNSIRPVLEARFPYLKFYELPDKSSFTFSISDKDENNFENFISLIDRPPSNSVIKLKYIKAEDLLLHLPPAVKADEIVLTGNNSGIFFKGTEENKKILLKELENVDVPKKRLRYDMLIVQFQKTANLNWSLKFEADNLVPGHKTLLTGTLGNLLNLNFDVVTVFGYLFCIKVQYGFGRKQSVGFC